VLVDIELMFVVAQASDAAHAAVFRRHRPDITLMDFRLPDAM
jgi:DNA-binding NarL/FixJ family response regulator